MSVRRYFADESLPPRPVRSRDYGFSRKKGFAPGVSEKVRQEYTRKRLEQVARETSAVTAEDLEWLDEPFVPSEIREGNHCPRPTLGEVASDD